MPLLPLHSAHHYAGLVRRWRAVAKIQGLVMRSFFESNGGRHFYLENPRPIPGAASFYLSAGIHGDEVGGTEGALAWAETNRRVLTTNNWLIFPCLNPHGLTHNLRVDADGRDLNRECHNANVPLIEAWRHVLRDRKFDLAICLHEDYDAQGFYIYELAGRPLTLSPILVEAAKKIIPPDVRKKIDNRSFRARSYMQRRQDDPRIPEGPESVYLGKVHAPICLTLETPSEFDLDRRVRVQRVLVETACGWMLNNRE